MNEDEKDPICELLYLSEVLDGYRDSWEGTPHKEGSTEAYTRGYNLGIQEQESLSWRISV